VTITNVLVIANTYSVDVLRPSQTENKFYVSELLSIIKLLLNVIPIRVIKKHDVSIVPACFKAKKG
jgi:hypothetical protein